MKFKNLLCFVLIVTGMTSPFIAVQFSKADTVANHVTKASTSEQISLLTREIARIETICVPRRGTSREQVERIFGPGQATFLSKIRPNKSVSERSQYRSYILCPNGYLFVNYDKDWKVGWAEYVDPYSMKGRPVGVKVSEKEQLRELIPRLAQMQQIWAAYEKRRPTKPEQPAT